MIGSYRGVYNEHLIFSSYEYIYCRILEEKNIKFKTQYQTFKLNNKQYTPDFFIFNDEGKIVDIIEIRGSRLNLQERIDDIENIYKNYKIQIKLITEIDLKLLCKEINLSYHQLKNEWRKSSLNILNNNIGHFNAMFGKKHSESTKSIISKKAKERMFNTLYKENIVNKLINFNRANNFYYAKLPRVERVEKQCLNCGKTFLITSYQNKTRKYCSNECSSKDLIKLASVKRFDKIKDRNEKVKKEIFNWSMNNKELIINIKFNSITPSLKNLLNILKTKYDIKDWRTITSILNTSNRKDFILKLQDYVKKN